MLRDRNDLDKHQKDAVWRILQSGSTLLAHVRRRRKDLDHGRRRDGNAPPGPCRKSP
jgi:hypothetical protein